MKTVNVLWRPRPLLTILLGILAVAPYWRLRHGQFLYDDYLVILTNPALWKVASLSDAFHFVLKPSKPVTNFLIALGHLIGGGVWGHRLISFAIHSATTMLFFRFLSGRMKQEVALAAALLFALSPIHTETLAIALFRMEASATLFTVMSWLVAHSLFSRSHRPSSKALHGIALFTLFGLAIGSKETFGFIFPVSLFFLFGLQKARWKFDAFLIVSSAVWGVVLLQQLKTDGHSDYPYQDVIGRSLLPLADQIKFGARSLLETFQKSFSAVSLTSVRLGDRGGLGSHWPFGLLIGVWLAPLIAFAAFYRRFSAETRRWILSWLAGTYLYLLIPNTNIGSEHYGYFPSLAFWVLTLSMMADRANLRRTVTIILVIALSAGTFYRTGQMGSRLEFSMADIERFPESAIPWNNVAVAILESQHPDRVKMAEPFVEKAVELAPWFPNVQLTRFLYQYERGDKKEAGRALKEIETIFQNDPVKVARYYRFFGMLQEKNL